MEKRIAALWDHESGQDAGHDWMSTQTGPQCVHNHHLWPIDRFHAADADNSPDGADSDMPVASKDRKGSSRVRVTSLNVVGGSMGCRTLIRTVEPCPQKVGSQQKACKRFPSRLSHALTAGPVRSCTTRAKSTLVSFNGWPSTDIKTSPTKTWRRKVMSLPRSIVVLSYTAISIKTYCRMLKSGCANSISSHTVQHWWVLERSCTHNSQISHLS